MTRAGSEVEEVGRIVAQAAIEGTVVGRVAHPRGRFGRPVKVFVARCVESFVGRHAQEYDL